MGEAHHRGGAEGKAMTTTPRTAAGRSLLMMVDRNTTLGDIHKAILAIEAEARQLEVGRLAEALRQATRPSREFDVAFAQVSTPSGAVVDEWAKRIAAAYAAKTPASVDAEEER
jgi:hypothetical protein